MENISIQRVQRVERVPGVEKSPEVARVSIALQLPELRELQHHVIRVHERDDEAGFAVAKPALEDVIARERDRRMKQQLKPRRTLAFLEHLPCRERRVPIHADQM